jgi:hypothetical protein
MRIFGIFGNILTGRLEQIRFSSLLVSRPAAALTSDFVFFSSNHSLSPIKQSKANECICNTETRSFIT